MGTACARVIQFTALECYRPRSIRQGGVWKASSSSGKSHQIAHTARLSCFVIPKVTVCFGSPSKSPLPLKRLLLDLEAVSRPSVLCCRVEAAKSVWVPPPPDIWVVIWASVTFRATSSAANPANSSNERQLIKVTREQQTVEHFRSSSDEPPTLVLVFSLVRCAVTKSQEHVRESCWGLCQSAGPSPRIRKQGDYRQRWHLTDIPELTLI